MTPEELSVAIADVVQDHLSLSMAPLLSDLKSLQTQVTGWESRWNDLGLLRERVAVVEAKSAIPLNLPDVVDLSPVLERLSATEARVSVLGDLRDRVVTIETKAVDKVASIPPEPVPAVDLSPVLERMAAAEARLSVLGDLRDRVVVVETKAAQPVPPVDLGDVREKLAAFEADLRALPRETATDTDPRIEKLDVLDKELNALRERVAVAEMRQLIPGPPGHDGRDGSAGRDGKDGLDGLGWDDLNVSQIDERTFAVKCLRGLQVKELGTLTFPVQIYRGVYIEGKTYDRGDGVTWGGSEWHCNETTASKPGDGSKAWTLKVKRGRDGKDGRDAESIPIVSVKR